MKSFLTTASLVTLLAISTSSMAICSAKHKGPAYSKACKRRQLLIKGEKRARRHAEEEAKLAAKREKKIRELMAKYKDDPKKLAQLDNELKAAQSSLASAQAQVQQTQAQITALQTTINQNETLLSSLDVSTSDLSSLTAKQLLQQVLNKFITPWSKAGENWYYTQTVQHFVNTGEDTFTAPDGQTYTLTQSINTIMDSGYYSSKTHTSPSTFNNYKKFLGSYTNSNDLVNNSSKYLEPYSKLNSLNTSLNQQMATVANANESISLYNTAKGRLENQTTVTREEIARNRAELIDARNQYQRLTAEANRLQHSAANERKIATHDAKVYEARQRLLRAEKKAAYLQQQMNLHETATENTHRSVKCLANDPNCRR